MQQIKISKLDIFDADSLLSTPLPPQTFLIDGLLPTGLSILGGASKIGKSWLMLQICLSVATRTPLWGLETHGGDVLYLALEDTKSRLQSRLYQLLDEAPVNLRFAIACEKIGAGLEQQIGLVLQDFPQTRLIVLDTFQCARNSVGSAKDGMYAIDYADVSALKAVADRNNIGIIMVHHLRKLTDQNDPFNNLSGSTGIGGASDTSFILRRSRDEQNAALLVTGRDIEYQELILKFSGPKWELVKRKDEEEIQKEQVPDFIFRLQDFLDDKSEWKGTATQLLVEMNDTVTPANTVTKYVARYATERLVPHGIKYDTGRNHGGRWLSFLRERNERNERNCEAKNENLG